nr:hypothetical protein [Candidatus Nanoarchaeia archaeon]
MFKKAQAAMEFLMTYGWAVLVVMIIISSLYAMGIFSPNVPNSCKIDSPFNCVDIKAESNGKVTFAISSNDVTTADRVDVKNGVVICQPVASVPPALTVLEKLRDSDNAQQLVEFQCAALSKGDSVKGTIEIKYNQLVTGELGHTAAGTFYAKAE